MHNPSVGKRAVVLFGMLKGDGSKAWSVKIQQQRRVDGRGGSCTGLEGPPRH